MNFQIFFLLSLFDFGDVAFTGLDWTNRVLDYLNETRYDAKKCPGAVTGQQTAVNLQISKILISRIWEKDLAFDIVLDLRMDWYDRRLDLKRTHFNTGKYEIGNLKKHTFTFSDSKVWRPRLNIDQGLRSGTRVTQAARWTDNIVSFKYTGLVNYKERFTFKMNCYMDLEHYPKDIQSCQISLQSSNCSFKEEKLKWNIPVQAADVISTVRDFKVSVLCKVEDNCTTQQHFNGATYPCLKFTVRSERQSSAFDFTYIIPYICFMTVALISFSVSEMAPKVATISSAMVSMVVTWIKIHASKPSGSTTTYLEIWIVWHVGVATFVLMVEVFCHFLESAKMCESKLGHNLFRCIIIFFYFFGVPFTLTRWGFSHWSWLAIIPAILAGMYATFYITIHFSRRREPLAATKDNQRRKLYQPPKKKRKLLSFSHKGYTMLND